MCGNEDDCTILTHIVAFFINVLKLAQGLDDVDTLTSPGDNELRPLVQTVVQDLQCLEDMAPVLSLVVQSLVEHVHDVVEIARSVCKSTSQLTCPCDLVY